MTRTSYRALLRLRDGEPVGEKARTALVSLGFVEGYALTAKGRAALICATNERVIARAS